MSSCHDAPAPNGRTLQQTRRVLASAIAVLTALMLAFSTFMPTRAEAAETNGNVFTGWQVNGKQLFGSGETKMGLAMGGIRAHKYDELYGQEYNFAAYCLNIDKVVPPKGEPTTRISYTINNSNATSNAKSVEEQVADSMQKPRGNKTLAVKSLKKVLWYGYPHDAAGLKEKYGLNNDELEFVTGMAAHYWTDSKYNQPLKDNTQGFGGILGLGTATSRTFADSMMAVDEIRKKEGKQPLESVLAELTVSLNQKPEVPDWVGFFLLYPTDKKYQNVAYVDPYTVPVEIMKKGQQTSGDAQPLKDVEFKLTKLDYPLYQVSVPGDVQKNPSLTGTTYEVKDNDVDVPADLTRHQEQKLLWNQTWTTGSTQNLRELIEPKESEGSTRQTYEAAKKSWDYDKAQIVKSGMKLELIPGKYRLEELKTPEGYTKISPIEFEVTAQDKTATRQDRANLDGISYWVGNVKITKNENAGNVVTQSLNKDGVSFGIEKYEIPQMTVENRLAEQPKPKPENVKINVFKHDFADRTKTLPGAKLLLVKQDRSSVTDPTTLKRGTANVDYWEITTSDQAAEVTLPKPQTAAGDVYTLFELETPEGYDQANPIVVTVKQDGTVQYQQTGNAGAVIARGENSSTVYMADVKKPEIPEEPKEEVTVKKVWIGDGIPAQLKIQAAHSTNTENVTLNAAGNWQAVLTKFKLDEASGWKLYELNDQNQQTDAHIHQFGGQYWETSKSVDAARSIVTFTNKAAARVAFKKVDEAGAPLYGATLKIVAGTDPNGATVGNQWTTSQDSALGYANLAMGEYLLVEVSAPANYEEAEPVRFKVAQDHKVYVADPSKPSGWSGAAENTVTMTDTYSAHKVKISKQILGQGKELPGATLTLTQTGNAQGNALNEQEQKIAFTKQWTSQGDAQEFELKPGVYTLTEDAAPVGYEKAESIEFQVGIDGGVTLKNDKGKVVAGENGTAPTVVMEDKPLPTTPVTLSKTDIAGKELAGATITVTALLDGNKMGNVLHTWESDGNTKTFDLPDGRYRMRETLKPHGYEFASDIDFTVQNGTVTRTDKVSVENKGEKKNLIVMTDGYEIREVLISKQALGQGSELAGAHLKVTQTALVDGSKLPEGKKAFTQEWTSKGSAQVLTLEPGIYTLTEDAAPVGYEKAEMITFRVNLNGSVDIEQKDKSWKPSENAAVVMFDALSKHKVKISKQILGQGKELPGATLTLTQTGNAQGNALNEQEQKTAFTKQWTSQGNAQEFELKPGVYTLTEDAAPVGYEKAEMITFRVNLNGSVDIEQKDKSWKPSENAAVVMFDALSQHGVKISKQILGQGKELAGAQLSVVRIEDQNGAKVKADDVIKWTSDGKAPKSLELTAGTYTLTEDAAPVGYEKAEMITFRVNLDGSVQVKQDEKFVAAENATVVMLDAKTPEPEKPETPTPEKPATPTPKPSDTPTPKPSDTPTPETPGTPTPEKPETPTPEKPGTPTPEKPGASEQPKKEETMLSNTGATVGVIAGGSLVLLLAGGGLMLARRRRTND